MDVGDVAGNPILRSMLGDSFPASPTATLRLSEEAGVNENSHVLHIGAGVGTVCQMLIETYGCKATGIMEMEELLQYATFKDDRVSYVHASLSQLPFQAGLFTHVLIEARCYVLPQLDQILIEARRVLRSDGILMMNDAVIIEGGKLPKTLSNMVIETQLENVISLRTANEISSLIEARGFQMDQSQEESGVTERILGKLQHVTLMMKMAIRMSGFNPKTYGIPFTIREILSAYEEIRTIVADDTIQWYSWRATSI